MNWIILALLLILPGVGGLGWGYLHTRSAAGQHALAVQSVSTIPSSDEYLEMYEQWSQLTAAQKAENPWGQGRYGGPDIQKRLRQDQSLRLEADLPDLDAGLKSYPPQLADVLYGSGWAQRLSDYQQQRERHTVIQIVSAILCFSGGLLLCGGLIYVLLSFALQNKQDMQSDPVHPAAANRQSNVVACAEPDRKTPQRHAAETGKDDAESDSDYDFKPDSASSHKGGYFGAVMGQQKRTGQSRTTHILPARDEGAVSLSMANPASAADKDSYFGWALDSEEEPAAVATMMTTEPVTHGLSELTEEVSAIRQYAAAQQDQMRKLQDGYDWMIVRRFCLRIIRCIDNLDDRRTRLGDEEQSLGACLEDIRDELVFALESSGVEQYQPTLNAPFKGLEKYAEAVRQRIPAPDAALAGTIAEIVRPGYQYLISDDDVKIVRCAQVKLYDAAETEG
jgi:molecular chaperone GrpE (heat shock protein)